MVFHAPLTDVPDRELVSCLNSAFSDYPIPIHMTEEELLGFFKTSGIDRALSFAAFSEDQMIGFILNSRAVYRGKMTVFDAGTGVIPEQRGHGVFTALYRFAEQELRQLEIETYCLEVLQQNERAVSLYQRLGFSVVRSFSVLKASAPPKASDSASEKVRFVPLAEFRFSRAERCRTVEPSFEHSFHVLSANPSLYGAAYLETDGRISAFCIYGKADGRILQLGYTTLMDLGSVLRRLLSEYDGIVAKNIDTSYPQVLDLLASLGFREIARQFEMAKDFRKK